MSSGLPSPRIQHNAGDVAPAMSPLDVFAAQSRALAKRLEETRMNGRRVSRLPPLAVADGLAKKPGQFHSSPSRSMESSRERGAKDRSPEESTGNRREIESPTFRPKSFYPRLSEVAATPDGQGPSESPIQTFSTPMEYQSPTAPNDYFGARRSPSPEHVVPLRPSLESYSQSSFSKSKTSFDSISRQSDLERGLSIESSSSRRSHFSNSLLPPNPPYARKAPSIRSVDSDDESLGITPSSSSPQHRKQSSSSGFSIPHSPQLPFAQSHNRSPSVNSEYSISGNRLSRPAFNFSRPLSRNSRPSMDYPSRMSSTDSHPRIYGDEAAHAQMSMDNLTLGEGGEQSVPKELGTPGAQSYIYAKYSLPRGRMLSRDSVPNVGVMPHFEWEIPIGKSNVNPIPVAAASLPTPPHSIESDRSRNSFDTMPARPQPIPASQETHRHSMTSIDTANSGSTSKGSQHTVKPSTNLTAEDHLNKGIECHERGSLQESTYHLRLASRQNNPTAMLLYALACRHGWGMRPNPAEGIAWLRKAMDCASIEITNDDEGAGRGRPGDLENRKTRKAQFALSVYELGVSHMNGWGIEQDRSLALRCFEIASSWGDPDAMAEAGFCYAQGVGCKKDLMKAAKYYRNAEANGMSMVGNSW